MSNHYLEFDSSFRDRNQYPSPANFVVEISQTGQKTKESAKDPVSNASPILVWNSSFQEDAAATSVAITGIVKLASISDPTTFIILADSDDLRNVPHYYTGAVLRLTYAGPPAVIIGRRILAYQRINTTQAQVTVDGAIPDTFFGAAAISGTIENPTGATDTDAVPKVFIPGIEIHANNFFINYLVQNITTGQSFTITAYDGVTHMATISGNTVATWLNANQNFVIRKQVPTSTGNIQTINSIATGITTAPLATAKAIQLASTASSIADLYVGSFLRMVEPVPTAPFSTTVSPYGEERRIARYITGDGILTFAAGTNVVNLDPTTSSPQDGYYIGAILTDVTAAVSAEVIAYVGATRQVTLAVNLAGSAAGDVWQMRTAILISPFGTTPVVGVTDAYEVELYSRDNCVPFAYTGSLTSVQEMVCCEVELLNLILPNTLLASGRGGRPVFYPYMYVELQQVTASSGSQKGLIYSVAC
jgi:hypothetical protein